METELASSPLSLSGLARVAGLFLLLAGLGAAGFAFGPELYRELNRSANQAGDGSKIARRFIVYRLDPARPTVFRFSQPMKLTRIYSMPIIESSNSVPGREWTYGVRVQLIAVDGRRIATHDVYSHSGLIGPSGERMGNKRYFRESTDEVGSPDEVQIASSEPIAAVVMFAGPSRPQVKAVDVRVYERRYVTIGTAATGFSRLNPVDRARMARANAFPSDMLTSQEKANIAVNQWRPIGPAGIEGRDYRMLVQYESEQPDPEDGEGAE